MPLIALLLRCACPGCSGHTFVNKGVGATSSGIFTACVEKMVEPVSGGRTGCFWLLSV